MTKLKKPVTFETAFGAYVVDELLGEGGAGRVYGGMGPDGTPVALKVLAEERASADKRRRIKNELPFLVRNKRCHIVTIIDHGVARGGAIEGPCYVMRRYQELMQGRISSDGGLTLFS
jgi:serine/threonine protein kinase